MTLQSLFLTLTSFTIFFISPATEAAVFGQDNREEAYFKNGIWTEISRSVAVGVLSTMITPLDSSQVKIDSTNKTDFLCSDEKFFGQPSLSFACTGFLIAPQILVTAGHCAYVNGEISNDTEDRCSVYNWMFDYRSDSNINWKNSPIVSAQNIYRCQKIIYAVMEESAPYRDFAVIRLDRPVIGRTPLKTASSFLLNHEELTMLGHPLGLPLKVTDEASVLQNNPLHESFLTNLDAFEGNSGSPVMNSRGEVVGLLTGGTPSESLFKKIGETCERVNRCDNQGLNCLTSDDSGSFASSEVQRIESVLKYLK